MDGLIKYETYILYYIFNIFIYLVVLTKYILFINYMS